MDQLIGYAIALLGVSGGAVVALVTWWRFHKKDEADVLDTVTDSILKLHPLMQEQIDEYKLANRIAFDRLGYTEAFIAEIVAWAAENGHTLPRQPNGPQRPPGFYGPFASGKGDA